MSGLRHVYTSFFFIALGGFLFGYIIGVTSDVVTSGQLLCPDGWNGAVGTMTSRGYHQCYQLTDLQIGLFSSVNLIGACISSLICFCYSGLLGRKLEMQFAAALYFVGAILTATSPVQWGILAGFTVYGLGVGFAMHAAPVYIAEMAPASLRGTLVAAKEAVIVFGLFSGFVFGFFFTGMDTVGWRYMVSMPIPFALIMGIGISYIPESPRVLMLASVSSEALMNQDSMLQEARSALQFFRDASSPEEVEPELQTMRRDIIEALGEETTRWTDVFSYRLPLLIGCGLAFLQQVTGQPSVLYFATNVFKDAGFGAAAALPSMLIGFVKLLATLFTVWRVDSYGRRPLLFLGISMMAVALLTLGTAFLHRSCSVANVNLQDCDEASIVMSQHWACATVAALMIYVSGYQIGFGPISWLMISEIFPLKVRGAALSIASIVNFGSNIAMTLTFKLLQTALSETGVFYAYFGLCLISLAFVKTIVPETKGRTLEEIEMMLAGKMTVRAPAGYGSTV